MESIVSKLMLFNCHLYKLILFAVQSAQNSKWDQSQQSQSYNSNSFQNGQRGGGSNWQSNSSVDYNTANKDTYGAFDWAKPTSDSNHPGSQNGFNNPFPVKGITSSM